MADSSSRPTSAPAKIRRRNRMITSCLECRRRKLKCDKSHPCINCKRANRDCVFLAPALDSASQLKLTEVKEKMGMLEVSLEQEIARHSRVTEAQDGSSQPTRISIAPDEENLEPTPTALADAMFDDDEPDNDFHDLGFVLGKCRLTDRVGGFFRPAMVEEVRTNWCIYLISHIRPC